tara:strand:- start:536 stop:1288 length:753 start_codon:yes stop_codon:yes gene_type:complete
MFDKIKKYFSDKNDEKAVLKSPLHVTAMKAGLDANKELGLDKMAEKFRAMQGEYIGERINELLLAPDQFKVLREMVANVVLELSSYEVLIIQKGKNGSQGLLEHKGISGKLHQELDKLYKTDKKFKENLHGTKHPEKITTKYLYTLTNGFYIHAAWKFRVINAIRVYLKDYNSNTSKDWITPFRYCTCVWYEGQYRKTLKLKQIVSDINRIQYSTFTNLVLNGEKYPDLEFSESHKHSIKKKELYYPSKW